MGDAVILSLEVLLEEQRGIWVVLHWVLMVCILLYSHLLRV